MSVNSRQSFDDKKDHEFAIEAVDPDRMWDPEANTGGLQRGLKNRHSEWLLPVPMRAPNRAPRGRRRDLQVTGV